MPSIQKIKNKKGASLIYRLRNEKILFVLAGAGAEDYKKSIEIMKSLSRKGSNLAINLVNKLSIIEILVFIKHYVDILVGCDSSLVTLRLFLVRRRFPFLDLQIRLLLPHIRTRHL